MTEAHTTAVVVAGDLHINSTTALLKPGFVLDEGVSLKPSRMQRELWRAWVGFWERVRDKHPAGEVVLILNGDLLETDWKGRTYAVHSRNRADIIRMAYETLEPALEVAGSVYVVRGTEAHVGGSGEFEELLAQDITNAIGPNDTVKSWWHLEREFSGVRFDVAHHVSMGGLPHTEKNAANKLANNVIHSYGEIGKPLPHLVLRSHVHRVSDTGMGYRWSHDLRALTVPAWETRTPFVRRISNGTEKKPSQIGLFTFVCENGNYAFDYLQVRLHREFRRTWTKHRPVAG